MWISRLLIEGFRGVRRASFNVRQHSVFVGPNGSGKSTLVDALSLLLGRNKMVRSLTEYDFFGGNPRPEDRFRIVGTVTGFDGDVSTNLEWFGGRAVPKWLDKDGRVHATERSGTTLCAQIALAGRFDHDELVVETVRYFHDDDSVVDPFADAIHVEHVPPRLLADFGFFVLPARRSWEGTTSFNSELFRKIVSSVSGIPATEILEQRDRLRNPEHPVEESPKLASLVGRINEHLAGLLYQRPEFRLRVTAGDSESVLQSLFPHYSSGGVALPVSRHGSGLLSLQTLLLLLEVGRGRKEKGLPFVLALEEPELHLSPGLQARLIVEATATAGQTICTTHSPQIAALHDPTEIFVMSEELGKIEAKPFLAAPLSPMAPNAERRLYVQNRASAVHALMHPFVIVPEGRFDAEWLRRLASISEAVQTQPPFTSVFGLAPTEDAAILLMAERLRGLRPGILALVDGDPAGNDYATKLSKLVPSLDGILAWPKNWTVEDVVLWVVAAEAQDVLADLTLQLGGQWTLGTIEELRTHLKTRNDPKAKVVGLKEDVLAHDAIVGSVRERKACVARAAVVLDALVSAAQGVAHHALEPHPLKAGTARRLILS